MGFDGVFDAGQKGVAIRDFAKVGDEGFEIVVVVIFVTFQFVVRFAGIEVVFRRGAQAEQGGNVHLAVAGRYDMGAGTDVRPQVVAQSGDGPVVEQIGLVEQDHVGAAELVFEQFVQRAFVVEFRVGLALGIDGVLVVGKAAFGEGRAIDHCDDAVDGDARADFRPAERLHERLRQGQAGGLDDDVIGGFIAVDELLHGRYEIIGHGAADAAVGQFDHVVLTAQLIAATLQYLAIDTDVAEFVDDQGDALAVGVFQHVVHEGGLAGTEEAGDDGGGNFLRGHEVASSVVMLRDRRWPRNTPMRIHRTADVAIDAAA